jgi:hypothetical protein
LILTIGVDVATPFIEYQVGIVILTDPVLLRDVAGVKLTARVAEVIPTSRGDELKLEI